MPELEDRDKFERRLRRALTSINRVHLARLLEHLGDPPRLENVPPEFWDQAGEELRQVLMKHLEETFVAAAQQLLDESPFGLAWEVVNERAVQWARDYTYDLVTTITTTNRRYLQRYIGDFWQQAQRIQTVQDRIALHEDFTRRAGRLYGRYRAFVIARTEITRAAVQGELGVVEELRGEGVELTSWWYTRNDEIVCPICGPLHKKARGEGWHAPPPAHPNCRCWLVHLAPGKRPKGRTHPSLQPRSKLRKRTTAKERAERLLGAPAQDYPWGDILGMVVRQAKYYIASQPYRSGQSPVIDYSAVKKWKHRVVSRLSKVVRLPYEWANRVIGNWAITSNDEDAWSLSMQEAAAAEFGVQLSEWQRNKLEITKKAAQNPRLREYVGRAAFAEGPIGTPEANRWSRWLVELGYDAYGEAPMQGGRWKPPEGMTPERLRRLVLRKMYEATQADLADAGVTHLVLYRGVRGGAVVDGLRKGRHRVGDVVEVIPNAMESWTIMPPVALDFAGGEVGAVLRMVVPRERVLATARTGYGCYNEWECVVIGPPKGHTDKVEIVAGQGSKMPGWNIANFEDYEGEVKGG
jgi:hypothetical protein